MTGSGRSSVEPVSMPGPDRDQWLAVEMRHLVALAAVAEEASFSGAAERLGYVQSAISQQIASLERIVGCRLVERSGRPRSVELTDAGAVILDHLDEILTQLRLAKRDLDVVTDREAQPLLVGTAKIFGSWLPAALHEHMAEDAGYHERARLDRGSPDELLEAVAAGRLDAAFVELPIATGPIFAVELLSEPCVLVSPGGKPHRMDVVSVLDRWPIVDVDHCQATRAVRAWPGCRRSQHSVDCPASALSLVRSRVAAAVMTRRDLPVRVDGLHVTALHEVPHRTVALAWHRDRDGSPAIGGLRAAATAAFAIAPPEIQAARGSATA